MKTLSGTFTLVALAAVGIASIVMFHASTQAQSGTDAKFVLNIPERIELKKEKEKEFVDVLNRISTAGAQCRIEIVHEDGQIENGPPFKKITTTNIIRSQKTETGGARIHVTQQVASSKPADLIDVLNTF
jgi:hypothetical protein